MTRHPTEDVGKDDPYSFLMGITLRDHRSQYGILPLPPPKKKGKKIELTYNPVIPVLGILKGLSSVMKMHIYTIEFCCVFVCLFVWLFYFGFVFRDKISL